jgi:hypothetical protein
LDQGSGDDSDEDEYLQTRVSHESNGTAVPPRDVSARSSRYGADAAQVAVDAGALPLPTRDPTYSAAAATAGTAAVNTTIVDDAAARAEADETKDLAETMEEAGDLDDPEAFERGKALYAKGLWRQAAELFAQAVGDADI